MELLLRSAWKLKGTHTSKNKTKQRDLDDEEEIKKNRSKVRLGLIQLVSIK